MTATAATPAGPRSATLLRRPGYPAVVTGSLLWHTNRWGSLFAVTLLLTRQGASAMHVQAVGALFFTPMLLGALMAGWFAKAAPRTVVLVTQLVLLPVQVAMTLAVAAGVVQAWMPAVLILLVGIGNTVNMTSQRMLVQDVAGPVHAPAALKFDPVLSGVGVMVGSSGTGVIVDHAGTAASFGVIAALGAVCALITMCTPAPPRRTTPRPAGPAAPPPGAFAVIRRSPALMSMIAVTLVMNLCVFGYTSLVPKISQSFTTSASVAGLLAAASGLGQLTGGLVITAVPIRRRGTVLFAGSAVAAAGVCAVAAAPTAGVAFVALLVAGLGQSGFSAMQSMIAVDITDDTLRTVTLGAVSTAVGSLPLGMLVIGGLAQSFGVRGGLAAASATGLATLVGVAVAVRRAAARAQDPVTSL